MVNLTIDNKKISVPEHTSILDAAAQNGINIPSLCYLKDLNEIGACRVCLVEVEGNDRLITSCNNTVKEGLIIETNSPKVREARKTNVELILSQHNATCAECVRSGNCNLQTVSNDLGIDGIPYEENIAHAEWPKDFPLIRDEEKCIKCMRCIQVCDKVQDLNVWDITNTGSRTTVNVSGNKSITESNCSLCGQCITHCPVGALRERNDVDRAFDALARKDKITVVQIAPAVRTAWAEELGIDREFASAKRLVSALRKMGFDFIFDTNFSADLTIMEEGSEFIERLGRAGDKNLPMYTSCCPGWVRFVKSEYPDMVDSLSTAKSPQAMFGAISKTYYAELLDVDPSRIFNISIMPCTAKKYEATVPELSDAGAGQDVDLVLTTREIARMIRAEHINVKELEEEDFDMPLGAGTGAAVIFGVTGGVMEAALRSAYYLVTKENPDPDAFKDVRGREGWRESTFDLAGSKLRVAVASGLGNARRLVESVRAGEVEYDFIEIMACPGGCTGGGGQPIEDGKELAEVRGDVLYGLDKANKIRFSHENPSVIKCYEDFLGAPLSHKSHKLLHTRQRDW